MPRPRPSTSTAGDVRLWRRLRTIAIRCRTLRLLPPAADSRGHEGSNRSDVGGTFTDASPTIRCRDVSPSQVPTTRGRDVAPSRAYAARSAAGDDGGRRCIRLPRHDDRDERRDPTQWRQDRLRYQPRIQGLLLIGGRTARAFTTSTWCGPLPWCTRAVLRHRRPLGSERPGDTAPRRGPVGASGCDMRGRGVEAVAVAFLHAYANPVHERAAKTVLERQLPGSPLHLVGHSARVREFERAARSC